MARLGKKREAASENRQQLGKFYTTGADRIVNLQDSVNTETKDRLNAELQRARTEFRRAKMLYTVSAETAEPDPSGGPALTITKAEYDWAANQYHSAVNSFADFILNQAIMVDT
jgi:hypothetical protein